MIKKICWLSLYFNVFINLSWAVNPPVSQQSALTTPLTAPITVNQTAQATTTIAVVKQSSRTVQLPTTTPQDKIQMVPPKNNLIAFKKPSKGVSTNRDNQKASHFCVSADWGGLSSLNATGVEAELRLQKWGVGAFGNSLTSSGGDAILSGYSFGLIGHYYILPYWYTASKSAFAPGFFLKLGAAKLTSSLEGVLPMYLLTSIGTDVSFMVVRHVSLYSRLGIDYISSAAGFSQLGPELTIGLKIGF